MVQLREQNVQVDTHNGHTHQALELQSQGTCACGVPFWPGEMAGHMQSGVPTCPKLLLCKLDQSWVPDYQQFAWCRPWVFWVWNWRLSKRIAYEHTWQKMSSCSQVACHPPFCWIFLRWQIEVGLRTRWCSFSQLPCGTGISACRCIHFMKRYQNGKHAVDRGPNCTKCASTSRSLLIKWWVKQERFEYQKHKIQKKRFCWFCLKQMKKLQHVD